MTWTAARGDTRLINGNFEGVFHGHFCGWAARDDGSDEPVLLSVQIDDREPVHILADCFRADLEGAGIGAGCHAFRAEAAFNSDAGGTFTVTFRDAESGELALGSPHVVVLADLAQFCTKKGVLDTVRGSVLRGWACDTVVPDQPVVLEMLVDGQVVKTFETTNRRPDLEEFGLRGGLHGFEVSVPDPAVATVPCSLHIRFRDGHFGLTGSPVGYFNPGDILGVIGRLEDRLSEQEDRLLYLEYLLRDRTQ